MDNLKEVTHIPTASTTTNKVKQQFLLLNVLYLGGHFSVEYTPVFYFEEEDDDEKSTAAADDNERPTAAARTTPCRARTSSGVMVLVVVV